MIRYRLKCKNDHGFESWFASAAACDRLMAGGRVSCIHCGSTEVSKSLMAPAVNHGGEPAPAADRPLSTPANPVEAALAALRREIEANSDYVGMNFVTEARAIHDGSAPERAIFGEARLDEARKLLEDGVPVSPLPFLSPRRAN